MKTKYSASLMAVVFAVGSIFAGSPANADSTEVIDRSPVLRQATVDDFPVTPEVGKSATVSSRGKQVTVTRVTLACSMSYSLGTPYKANNRVNAYADIARSSGCSGNLYVYANLWGTNFGGGDISQASNGITLEPGTAAYLPLTTNTCTYGYNANWHSNAQGWGSGNNSPTVTLPCHF